MKRFLIFSISLFSMFAFSFGYAATSNQSSSNNQTATTIAANDNAEQQQALPSHDNKAITKHHTNKSDSSKAKLNPQAEPSAQK